ncbi:hypothetical protein [Paucibacter soli]|uniref:hypothetical protein n=1 Tax=Paucibacter soli TaxID=3133433 RepID=UPI0030986B7E
MPAETFAPQDHAALLATVIGALSTRSVHHFAAEARLDGESLQQAVERYEIDYAWHVLGSARLREATVARLEHRLRQPASAAQQRCIAEVLHAAASAQDPELLMSYDNDVAEQLAAALG